MTGFINTKYRPNMKKDLVVTFYLEANGDYKTAAAAVAGESSIGSWTELSTLKPNTAKKLGAKVFYLNRIKKIIKIAYPIELFELGSVPQFLSSVGGNIFSMKMIKNLRLVDVEFPDKYINSFKGPEFGVNGIRKILKNRNKLILGSIIKPKVGLSPKEQAELSYEIWKNGIDLVKDDENLTSMNFNNFDERVKRVLAMRKKVERETGKIKLYTCNITAEPEEMLRRAKLVKKHGGRVVMIDIVAAGLGAVQFIRNQNLGLIIHGHRAGHSMFTRSEKHGMSFLVLAKLARLVGIDQLHTGTVVGKMDGTADIVIETNEFLRSKFGKLKPVLPIASGGLHPFLLTELVEILGTDLIANFGGGVHGHSEGSGAGARACAQAKNALAKGHSLAEYAVKHEELATALSQWS
jgi:ribulose-bisphosphate carboxylase large chain